MKKYIIGIFAFGLLYACGPTPGQDKEVEELAAKYKNTSIKAMTLSEKIGEYQDELQATNTDSLATEQTRKNPCSDLNSNYESMKSNINVLISNWGEASHEVDRLTNEIGIGKWTEEDQESLKKLTLEVDQKEAEIAKWDATVDSLYMSCQDSVIISTGK